MDKIRSVRLPIVNLSIIGLGLLSLFTGNQVWAWYLLPFILLYLLIMPGFLLLQLIGFSLKLDFKRFIYAVCLSILFLYGSGLLINFGVPMFSRAAPLTPESIRIHIFLIVMIVASIACFKTWNSSIDVPMFKFSFFKVLSIIFWLSLPLLAAYGAMTLNAGGNNYFTVSLLVIIGIVFVFLGISGRLRSYYTLILFSISLGLLWMLSLRSSYPVGWDIAEEMAIFKRTQEFGKWIPVAFNPAYNACMSISIFPTILSAFIPLSNSYIFKLIFPALFSLVPVSGYLLGKRVFGTSIAFMGIFYMMSQPFFIQPMTGLARQMIGFLFFGALLLNLFSKEADSISSKFLNFLLVIGMILSHYSTSYLAIFFMIGVYVCLQIVKNKFVSEKLLKRGYTLIKQDYDTRTIQRISLSLVCFLIVFTMLWYVDFNQTSTGLGNIAMRTWKNLSQTFDEDVRNGEVQKATEIFSTVDTGAKTELLSEFVDSNINFFNNTDIKYEDAFNYQVFYIPERSVRGLVMGEASMYVFRGFEIVKAILKAMIPIGSILLIVLFFRKARYYREFILMSVFANFIITLLIVHPTLSASYNLSRLSVQSLLFLSLAPIYGLFVALSRVKDILKRSIISFLVVSVFVLNYGLVAVVIGGYPFLHLYNYGDDYNKSFYHEGEIKAAQWLRGNKEYNTPIFTDTIGNLKLMMGGQIRGLPSLVPTVVYRKSYVYQRTLSAKENVYSTSFAGQSFSYSFSRDFLDNNKSLIYNNGESKIYR